MMPALRISWRAVFKQAVLGLLFHRLALSSGLPTLAQIHPLQKYSERARLLRVKYLSLQCANYTDLGHSLFVSCCEEIECLVRGWSCANSRVWAILELSIDSMNDL